MDNIHTIIGVIYDGGQDFEHIDHDEFKYLKFDFPADCTFTIYNKFKSEDFNNAMNELYNIFAKLMLEGIFIIDLKYYLYFGDGEYKITMENDLTEEDKYVIEEMIGYMEDEWDEIEEEFDLENTIFKFIYN